MGQLTQLQQIGIGAVGVGVLGSLVSGYGQYQQGQQSKAAYDYNADVAVLQAEEQMQNSEARYTEIKGRQASAYARAGVDIASGSPLLIMAHTAAQGSVEQEREYQAGQEKSALLKYEGKVAAFEGTMGGISSFLGGLSKGALGVASILA